MKRKYRNMSIRIISLISSLVILISGLAVSVSATDFESDSSYQPTFIDLLSAVSYTITAPTGAVTTSNDPMVNFSTTGTAVFQWGDGTNRFICDYLMVAISAPAVPSSVSLWGTSIAGTLCSSGGGVYFYKFDTAGRGFMDLMKLSITMNTTGLVSLYCFWGLTEDSVDIASASLSSYSLCLNSDDQSYYKQNIDSLGISLPYTYLHSFLPGNEDQDMYLTIDFECPVSFIDTFTFCFDSINLWDNYYDDSLMFNGYVYLVKDDVLQESLGYDVASSVLNTTYEGLPIYSHTVSLDLTGYDLTGCHLFFKFYLAPRYPISGANYRLFYFSARSAAFKIDSYSQPWYIRFFHWIQNEFTALKETIQGNSISDDLNEVNDSVNNSFADIESDQTSLNDKVADLQTDWSTQQLSLNSGMQSTYEKSRSAMTFLSGLADRIYNNMGWFGSVYTAVGLVSVIMLILSKSGLSHKIGNYVNGSIRSGDNGGKS